MKRYRVLIQDIEVQGILVQASSETAAKARVQEGLDNGSVWESKEF